MGEPRAITYKEVQKASMDEHTARDMWTKINGITGAGALAQESSSIDLTNVSDSDRARIDKLLTSSTEDTEHADTTATTKRGNK